MSELPKAWEWSTVGEVARVVRGVTYKKHEAKTEPGPGLVPLLRATNIDVALDFDDLYYVPEDRVAGEQHLRCGDIVVAASSGSVSVVGKSARLVTEWTGTFGGFCSTVRASLQLSSAFLGFHLQSDAVRRRWSDLARGSNINNLKVSHFIETAVPLPPAAEQERIVAAIEEAVSKLDAGEGGLRTVRQLLKRMRDAILVDAVTGRLVSQDPTDTPATKLLADLGVDPMEAPDDKALPDSWAWVDLGAVSSIGGGIQKQPKRAPAANPLPFLRVANVGRGTLDLTEVHEIEVFDGELARYGLERGDLLVVEGNGSPDQVGRSAMWHGEIDPCVHQNHLIRVRPSGAIDPSYLELFWNSPSASRRVQAVASSTSGLHTLSTGKLKGLPVALPPAQEQTRIVAEVDRQMSFVEACERAVDAGLNRSAALRRSVLKAAFEGRLVPQDPTDEPASVLLERIRAERAAASKATARRVRSKP
jgi:type I restriction enzyme S subunit